MECIFSGFQNSNMYTVQFPSSSAILYANSEGSECQKFLKRLISSPSDRHYYTAIFYEKPIR